MIKFLGKLKLMGAFLTSHCQKPICPYKIDIRLNMKIHNGLVLSLGLSSYYWQLPVEC
jgi:hypothetical protein